MTLLYIMKVTNRLCIVDTTKCINKKKKYNIKKKKLDKIKTRQKPDVQLCPLHVVLTSVWKASRFGSCRQSSARRRVRSTGSRRSERDARMHHALRRSARASQRARASSATRSRSSSRGSPERTYAVATTTRAPSTTTNNTTRP